MAAIDFAEWVAPDLSLTVGGRTYRVRPPTVAEARVIVALMIRTEERLGLVPAGAARPEGLDEALDQVGQRPLGEVTLGRAVHRALMEDDVPAATVDRMSYYAMVFWARGRDRADAIARVLWSRAEDSTGGDAPGE